MKVHQQPAYLLHARPFSESSLLADLFTREHGRLSVLAKGARRGKSRSRGALLPFQPLLASWAGKGQLPVLTSVEPRGRQPGALMKGEALASGFYLNELLMRLLHRHDAHEALFEHYHDALARLSEAHPPRRILRIFEKHFLHHIGFGAVFDKDADTGRAIDPRRQYHYIPEKGPVSDRPPGEYALPVSGRTLHAMRDEHFPSERELREAKRLTRALIDRQLGGRPLRSRRVLMEMSRYR
ncbi:MAG: DNA repair protein RecO [Gammaproteobacteria bacterium]|nr:DNA repair protein RecO [Gammaproteobacteria bacterium]